MDTTNTAPTPTPAPVAATPPPAPMPPAGNDSSKMILTIVVLLVIVGCAAGALFLYQKMKENAMVKQPATNYVMEKANAASPTAMPANEPTVDPELSQPVAKDASGIDNEIKILDKTATGTDSTTVTTKDIQNVSQ